MGADRYLEERMRAPDRVGEADTLMRKVLRMRDFTKAKQLIRDLLHKWDEEDA